MKQSIQVPVLSDSIRKLAVPLSLATRANGFIFVSGTPPLDPRIGELVRGDILVQTEACLVALRQILEAAGSTMDKVIMTRIYATNSGFYAAINGVYARHFPVDPPSRTFVPVASWPMEFDIEIECTALA